MWQAQSLSLWGSPVCTSGFKFFLSVDTRTLSLEHDYKDVCPNGEKLGKIWMWNHAAVAKQWYIHHTEYYTS